MNRVLHLSDINVMLDLESFGVAGCPVLTAIGAVQFNEEGLGAEFYQRIDPVSCVKAGLVLDPATVLWWMEQGDAARLELTKPAAPLGSVLDVFDAWLASLRPADVWGNGATADNVWIGAAYRALGRKQPWPFTKDRCYRTLKALFPDVYQRREGVAHNALSDAKRQAKHVLAILETLKPAPRRKRK